jgi:hypothetical protein
MALNMDAMLRIKADVQGENNIRRLGNSMQGLQGQVKNAALGFSNLKGAVAGFGAAIAGSAVVAGLSAIVKKSIDAGDELFNLQAKTGVAANALIGIGNAAKLADVDMATLGKGLTKMNVNLVKAAEGNEGLASAFKRLGVDVKDASGQVLPTDKALKQIADRFADMPDGAQKAAAAVAIFGKAGSDLIPLLNEGGAAMDEFTYKVSEDFAARSDLFNDTITELGIKTQGFGMELTSALLPALQSILEVFADLFDTENDWTALFETIKVGLRAVATVLYATIKLVDQFVKAIVYSFDAIGKALQGDFAAAGQALSQGFGAGLEQAKRDFAQIGKLWTDSASPGTGRLTGGRNMELDTSSSDAAAASAARRAASDSRRAASEQERLLERRQELIRKGIALQQQLRESVEDVGAAMQNFGASPSTQLALDRNSAVVESNREIAGLINNVKELSKEFEAVGGTLDTTNFYRLIDALSLGNAELADKNYQQGLTQLTQQQQAAMTQLRQEAGTLTRDQERQLFINERLAQIQKDMPELYAAQKDEIDKLVTASAGLTEQQQRNKSIVQGIAQSIGDAVNSSLNLVIEGTKNWADSLREIASNLLRSIANQLLQIMVIQPLVKGITGAFGFAGGGIMTGDGPMPLKTYARGGIANSPQLAMFGEGSTPEAYVPLPDGRRIPVAMQGGGGGNTTVNVSVDAKGTSVQGNAGQGEALARAVAQAVQAELIKQKRPGGLLITA